MVYNKQQCKEQGVSISIVCPVYNDEQGIRRTLESLTTQTLSRTEYEIIVVDNKSTDETYNEINYFVENYPSLVKVENESQTQGSYAARNTGIKAADGKYIAFIDSDMWVGPNWLESILKNIEKTGAEYMGCNVEIIPLDNSIFAKYDQVTGFRIRQNIENSSFAPTCCLVVNKNVFKKVGLFDDTLKSGGDLEFGNRVVKNGISQYFSPGIHMYHPARSSLKELVRKEIRTTKGYVDISEKYPNRFEVLNEKDIRNYLPPNPARFVQIWRSHSHTVTDISMIFMIAYLLKLTEMIYLIHHKISRQFNNLF